MIALDVQSVAQLLTGRMLNGAAEGVLLAGLVWLLLRLIRRQNSGTRFAIWMMALVAVVSLPFFAGAGRFASPSAPLGLGNLHPAFLLPRSWALYLCAGWAAGASLLLLRLAVGMWRLRRLRGQCKEADPANLDPTTVAILEGAGLRLPLRLCLSDEVATPAVIGFFHPVIVIPSRLLPQLSAAELEIILLHEVAHLQRGDQWSNLLQKLLKAVFFFHPAVWWIEGQLTLEREMACDDAVLTHRTSPRDYAAVLIALAEKLHSAPALALAQALLSRVHQMSRRIAQILDGRRPAGAAMGKPILGGGLLLMLLAIGTVPYAPRLIAFRNPTSPLAEVSHPAAAETVAVSQAAGASAAQAASEQPMPIRAAWRASEPARAQFTDLRLGDPSRSRLHPSKPAPTAAILAKRNSAPDEEPSVLPAAIHARNAALPEAVPVRAEESVPPQASLVFDRAASDPQHPGPAAYIIVQTTMVDASGSRIWTVSVWRVEGGEMAKQLESAIALAI